MMEITSDTPVVPVVFTSPHTDAVSKSCLLLLRTELPSMESAVVALTAALAQWTKTTQDGATFLSECRYHISIADLAATTVFDNPDLRRIMLEHGLEYVTCHGTYCEPNIQFDRLLSDLAQCPPTYHQPDSCSDELALSAL